MLGWKKKKKKKLQGLSQSNSKLWYINFPDHYTSSRAPFLTSKPYLVVVCGAHDICDLPRLPPDWSGIGHRH